MVFPDNTAGVALKIEEDTVGGGNLFVAVDILRQKSWENVEEELK